MSPNNYISNYSSLPANGVGTDRYAVLPWPPELKRIRTKLS